MMGAEMERPGPGPALDWGPTAWDNRHGERKMKRVAAFCAFLVLGGSLYGQSVVELSRREKARRESLKGREIKSVTNADLAAVRKLPAVTVVTETAANPEGPAGPPGQPGTTARQDMVPEVAPNGPPMYKAEDAGSFKSGGNLESQLKNAHDEVERLTTQMNLLLQQVNNLNTMTPRDVIQQQIDETYQKLVKAQDDEAKLKSEIDAGKANPTPKR